MERKTAKLKLVVYQQFLIFLSDSRVGEHESEAHAGMLSHSNVLEKNEGVLVV